MCGLEGVWFGGEGDGGGGVWFGRGEGGRGGMMDFSAVSAHARDSRINS